METDSTKASVIIANYNNEKYLDECLSSLNQQSYKNLEIIIFDDASQDNSVSKIKKYKGIKFIQNKEKKNCHGSINQINSYKKAFQVCSGEIIFFLDSDDFFHENKIEIILDHFNKNINDQIIFDLPFIKYEKKLIKKKNKKKIIQNYWPYIPPQSCISIRKKTLEKMFDYIEIKDFYDIWFDFRIAIFAKYIIKNFFILDKNLTYYRKVNTGVSSNFKFLSKKWWNRRKQAHNYVKFFFDKNKIKHKKNIDYFITKSINHFIS